MHAIYEIKDRAGNLKFLHKRSAVFVQPNDSKNYYAIKQREALAIFVAKETKPHIKILVFILKNFMLCCVVLFWLWLCCGMRCCLKRDRIHVTAFVHMLVADKIKLTFETLSGFFKPMLNCPSVPFSLLDFSELLFLPAAIFLICSLNKSHWRWNKNNIENNKRDESAMTNGLIGELRQSVMTKITSMHQKI